MTQEDALDVRIAMLVQAGYGTLREIEEWDLAEIAKWYEIEQSLISSRNAINARK